MSPLESLADSAKRYIGVTSDLKARLAEHNAGKSTHTAKPGLWRIGACIVFSERSHAEASERYPESGSGHAFARKRLWP